MYLSGLYIYPVKSTAPVATEAAQVQPRGLAHDRRWMLVDADNRFITGRETPRLVLVRAQPDGEQLRLTAPGMPPLSLGPAHEGRTDVIVWRDQVQALSVSAAADAWFSQFLGRACRLVYMDAAARRPVESAHVGDGHEVSFADAYPLLLISEASLDGLNARLDAPVSMLRFRPNLVIAGTSAHAEDGWKRISIGALEFDVVESCTRCGFTTVIPETGKLDPRGEPLRTLAQYRRAARGVTFGQNLVARDGGTLRIGDPVTVLA